MALKHFAPFVPDAMHPFDARQAAHLLRRAGFGATPADVAAAVERGLDDTIDGLFQEEPGETDGFAALFEQVQGRLLNFGDANLCRAWWVHRMLSCAYPLREKLTLFWHGHFATSVNKVEDTALMLRQIDTLRTHAWGSFRELVLAIARDPAMIVWLDGQTNTREHPNENFARELMELFTCGIGHYTERDVQEAARAFTGWHRNEEEFLFQEEAHDSGPKRFLGKSGKFNGEDIVDLLMAQPATSTFLARKLLRFFATPDPADDVVAEAADVLDRGQLNIKWFVRELLGSQFFFSPVCYRQRISSPVEFVVGTLRTLQARLPAVELVDPLNNMGQELLAPPNVKGWDGEQTWINSTTLGARTSFARRIAELELHARGFGPYVPLNDIVPADTKSPEQAVDLLAQAMFQGDLNGETRADMARFLVTTEEGPQPNLFREDEGFRADRLRNLVAVMLSLPEYQAY